MTRETEVEQVGGSVCVLLYVSERRPHFPLAGWPPTSGVGSSCIFGCIFGGFIDSRGQRASAHGSIRLETQGAPLV